MKTYFENKIVAYYSLNEKPFRTYLDGYFFFKSDKLSIYQSMKKVKPFFTDKIKTKSKITLIEKSIVSQEGQEKIVSEKIITEDQAIAEVFNKFFINIVPNLNISTDHGYDNDFIATDDQVTNAVNKFRNYSSIIMIKSKKKMI